MRKATKTWGLSSAGRASALQAEGHRFEPYRSHSFYGWFPEWPKGTDCKSAANCFGGSNPPPSILPMWLNWQSSWFVISRLSVRVRSSAWPDKYIGSKNFISRDGAVWKLVGLITRRSQVQILLPQFLMLFTVSMSGGNVEGISFVFYTVCAFVAQTV